MTLCADACDLENIRIEEVAPVAQTRGRFDSEAWACAQTAGTAQLASGNAAPVSPLMMVNIDGAHFSVLE